LLTAFVIGLTLGLVWVPCAGPALGFALTLVRDQPGPQALLALTAYGVGAAVPLLLVGYGRQIAAASIRSFNAYSGRIKQVSGALLVLCALAFQYGWFEQAQVWIAENTNLNSFGNGIEDALFAPMQEDRLPKIVRAPEFIGLGPWHNSEPFTLASLKGKVVLVDFWTYSCINCIRTLPYMEGYWQKFKDMPFVLLGVHTPEFVFEKDKQNVADAIKRHGLTYPIAQDNDYGTWSAFANRYWPAKYLIDADGYIRYTHFGEGGYDETDLAIQSLLKELGKTSTGALIGASSSEGEYHQVSSYPPSPKCV
jgi:thiol-disulfide isomerase/thioredoxin